MFIIVSLYFLYFFVQKISHSYKLLVQNVDKIIPRDMIRNSCQAQKLFTAKQYHTEMYSSLLNEQERGEKTIGFFARNLHCAGDGYRTREGSLYGWGYTGREDS
jgi:hypothetical protein